VKRLRPRYKPIAMTSATVPRIDIAFPDITRYAAGNDGIPYVWTLRATQPGPHVVVQALTHGNEVCGAIAIDWLLNQGVRPSRGTLSLVFANVAAYQRFDRADPFASRCIDEDFNRLWTTDVLEGPRHSAELMRARALRPLYDNADALLDLHSMSEPSPPLALAGIERKGIDLARAVGVPALVVVDAGHASGRRLRDYGHFGDANDGRAALLIECGQHWEAAAPVLATQSMLRFLRHFDIVERTWADSHIDDELATPQRIVAVTATVTIATDDFRFTMPVRGLQSIAHAGTVYAIDGAVEIRTPHDECVLIMPTRRPRRGETAVRLGRFVA
jgi:predicted deacylase